MGRRLRVILDILAGNDWVVQYETEQRHHWVDVHRFPDRDQALRYTAEIEARDRTLENP